MQIVPTVKLYCPALGSLLLFCEAFFRARSALIGKSRKVNPLLKFLVIHIINIIQFSVFKRIAIRAKGLEFNSWVGQIEHNVANDSLLWRRFFSVEGRHEPRHSLHALA